MSRGQMSLVREDAESIARRFVEARRSAGGFAEYPGKLPNDVDQAYVIQGAAIQQWGGAILGWKIGRVGSPFSERLGVHRLAGPIFKVVDAGAGANPLMPVFERGFAAAEAEFLLRIGAAPPHGQAEFTLAEAAELIDAVHVGIEIASSPLRPINALGPIAIISDFGNNNGLVVGPAILDWRVSGFEQWGVSTRVDGREVGRGEASSFPDGAIGSARFLFELMARRGIELEAGQWISSGAVTGVHEIKPGDQVQVLFDRWYEVGCKAVAAEPE